MKNLILSSKLINDEHKSLGVFIDFDLINYFTKTQAMHGYKLAQVTALHNMVHGKLHGQPWKAQLLLHHSQQVTLLQLTDTKLS